MTQLRAMSRTDIDAAIFGPRYAAVAYADRVRASNAGRISPAQQRRISALMRAGSSSEISS